MQRPPLSGNKTTKGFSKKLRIKHEFSPRSKGPGLVTPLYETIPKLGDGGLISRREFVEQYGHSS
jgi:hypothetical protein